MLLVPAAAGAPLAQGDLLKVEDLHFTEAASGKPQNGRVAFGLVISRDCVAQHKRRVVVAHVDQVNLNDTIDMDELKSAKTAKQHAAVFDDLLRSLSTLRDGGLSPDRFYLGSPPDAKQRLVARLDEISTIVLPVEPAEWLRSNRTATLSADARRALGTRIFWAFTRVGFDDHEWLPDPDLKIVCTFGENAIVAAQQALTQQRTELEAEDARGGLNEKNRQSREQIVASLETDLEKIKGQVGPFTAERDRRASLVVAPDQATPDQTNPVS